MPRPCSERSTACCDRRTRSGTYFFPSAIFLNFDLRVITPNSVAAGPAFPRPQVGDEEALVAGAFGVENLRGFVAVHSPQEHLACEIWRDPTALQVLQTLGIRSDPHSNGAARPLAAIGFHRWPQRSPVRRRRRSILWNKRTHLLHLRVCDFHQVDGVFVKQQVPT